MVFPTFVEKMTTMPCSNLGTLLIASLLIIANERYKYIQAFLLYALIRSKCVFILIILIALNIHAVVSISNLILGSF